MRYVYAVLFFLFLSFSISASSGKVVVSGHIENSSFSSIKIAHLNNQELVETTIDGEGNFKMTARIEDGFYMLSYGRSTAYVYLHPKDNLDLSFDANNFEKTLAFTGIGSERNNYLAKKSILYTELTKNLEAFYKVDESSFLKNLKKVKNRYLGLLETFEVENFFKAEEKKSIEFERLLGIQNYKTSYKFYLGEEVTPSSNFYEPINSVDLGNHNDYIKQPYYRYLVNSVWSKRIEAAPDANEMLGVLRKVPSKDVAITLINGFYSKISSNKERAKDYLDLIKMVTNHQPFIDAAEKQYKEVMESGNLSKGDASPSFSYESVDGAVVSLGDLKGKYVYIDIWATWCAPCIKQVPYLKELEKRYHDKNIAFVSISVDKEEVKANWKKIIAKKQLGGIQLFADKSFDSEFMSAYAVNSIPRFILIDPEGKIVDTEAPRPSFDKTKVLLDELLD